jgi:hypothetical protein
VGLCDGHDRDLGYQAVLDPFHFQGVLEEIRSEIAIERTVGTGWTMNKKNGVRIDLEQLRNTILLIDVRPRLTPMMDIHWGSESVTQAIDLWNAPVGRALSRGPSR